MRYLHTEDVELLGPTQVGCYCKQKSLMPTAMSLWNILGPDAMLAELIGTICNNSLFNIYQKTLHCEPVRHLIKQAAMKII